MTLTDKDTGCEASYALLQHQEDEAQTLEPGTQSVSPSTKPKTSWLYVVIVCVTMLVLTDICAFLYQTPLIRLYESILCNAYFRTEKIPEQQCKDNHVQDELAMILGWQVLFDSLPGILLAVPYSSLADKYGRKWVLLLNVSGIFMAMFWTLFVTGLTNLPLRYTWFSAAFMLIGGGANVATAIFFTMMADVVPGENRSTVFFYIAAAGIFSELITTPFTSLLMEIDVWLPLVLSLAFGTFLILVAVFALPETLPPIAVESNYSPALLAISEFATTPDKGLQVRQSIKEHLKFLLRDKAVAALVVGFLVLRLGRQSMAILLQYVSKRYHWSLSKANLLLSLRAAVNLCLLVLVLPGISSFMLKKLTPNMKDLWISRGSVLLLVAGSIALGFSVDPALMIVGLIIYTLGTGYSSAVRSLITALVDTHESQGAGDVARVYAFIAIADGIGSLIAGPCLSLSFSLGLEFGGSWIGIPFFFGAAMFALTGLPIFLIRFSFKTRVAEDGTSLH